MKKIVSFDLDGTLVDGKYGDVVWNRGIPEEYAERYSIPFDQARAQIRQEYESMGDGNILWYEIGYWLDRFGLSVSAEELLNRYEGYIQLVPHAQEVIEALEGRYTLVVASNAARMFVEKELDQTGLAGHFAHIISATTDYRMVKKGGDFYRTLCAMLRAEPNEMVHVGDHPVYDYEAPSSIGIEAYCFRSQHSAIEGLPANRMDGRVIGSLKELLPKLLTG